MNSEKQNDCCRWRRLLAQWFLDWLDDTSSGNSHHHQAVSETVRTSLLEAMVLKQGWERPAHPWSWDHWAEAKATRPAENNHRYLTFNRWLVARSGDERSRPPRWWKQRRQWGQCRECFWRADRLCFWNQVSQRATIRFHAIKFSAAVAAN